MNKERQRFVRQSFSEAAPEYAGGITVQKHIAARLAALAQPHLSAALNRILDLGCGSCLFARSYIGGARNVVGLDFAEVMLCEARGGGLCDESVKFVCGDCETLPFANQSFDLLYSSSTLHWCGSLKQALQECRRVMRDEGLLLIATYGPDTLRELRHSWASVDDYSHTLVFPAMEEWLALLRQLNFTILSAHVQTELIWYDNVQRLLTNLKQLGVKNNRADRPRGLSSPKRLEAMKKYYDSFYKINGQIPASYEILFFIVKRR